MNLDRDDRIMDADKTGAYIASCRKKLGISQKELSDELNISNKTVSKWETGGGFPDISILPALAQRLNTSVDSILSGEDIEVKNGDINSNSGEMAEYLITKRTMKFKIQGIITIVSGIIGFILFFLIEYDESLSVALFAGSAFELMSMGMFAIFYYITKVEFDSYNRLKIEKLNFKEIYKPFALIGVWLWTLLPISAIIYFSFNLLPINYNDIVLIPIILVVYGALGFILTKRIKKG